MSSNNRFFEGLFVGGIIGFLSGLLFAPKPGSQFRRELAENSDEFYRQASTQLHDLKDRTGATLQDLQVRSDDVIRTATAQVQETRDQITSRLQDLKAGSNGPKNNLQQPQDIE
jgi:gas vesicle protein